MAYELDRDTALERVSEGRYAARVSDAWGIYGNPNGGYLAALLGRALQKSLPHPDPFSMTTHYLSPAKPGVDAEVHVEVVRTGRGHSTGVARLLQEGKEKLRAIATFGDLGAISGPTQEEGTRPPISTLDRCEPRIGPPAGSTFIDRIEARFEPNTTAFLDGVVGTKMELGGWMRLKDGREPDPIALLLFADAWPPPSLNAVPRVWIPTIELTVQVRRRPSPGWIRGWFRTRFVIEGYLEEDGELWDADGRLVALSRQLARVQG